ncbi:MAG: DNA oxidative demethylase AlkB [Zoogloeaceae bacterium]|jgi:alkylated DNA repair protein (DNA oxidative demethylase)|nr:DNA oxidative demethylase AlkB [Zoogloeaceae bacterium]
MTRDLFSPPPDASGRLAPLPGVALFKERLRDKAADMLAALEPVWMAAPFRHMQTRGGQAMSAAMTNCGPLGWVTDRKGYRYLPIDPQSGQPWPAMPEALRREAVEAAAEAGFPAFDPDACLINRYAIGAKMGLHQDRDEADFTAPIVSFSFGLSATFLLGGDTRGGKTLKFLLEHGDVLVWGGPARLYFHGIAPIKPASSRLPADAPTDCRINLTFRRAR